MNANPAQREEQSDLILHLLKYGDRIILVHTEDTSQLPAFTDLLAQKAGQTLKLARVQAAPALGSEEMLGTALPEFGLAVDMGESALHALETRLPEQLPGLQRAVLVVEDAQQLGTAELDGLVSTLQRVERLAPARFRLVLLGHSDLTRRLAGLPSMQSETTQVYALNLGGERNETTAIPEPPLAEQDAPAVEIPPAPEVDTTPPPFGPESSRIDEPATSASKPIPWKLAILGISALSVLTAIALALISSAPDKPEDSGQSARVVVPLQPETTGAVPASPSPTPPGVPPMAALPPSPPPPLPPPVTPTASPAPLPPAPPAPLPTIAPEPVKEVPATPKAPEKPQLPPPERKDADSKAPPPPAAPKKPETVEKAPAKPAKPAPAGDWFASQKASHYVLQIISLQDEKAIQTFAAKNGLKASEVHSFRQVRDGKTLHTLTYGLYPSADAAKAALAKLPEPVRKLTPYPRSIESVRQASKSR